MTNVATRTPWWKTTKTSRQGFMLGAVWAFVGLGDLVLVVAGGHVWYLFFGSGFLVIGIVYLASAFALRRREHSAVSRTGQPGSDPASPRPPDRCRSCRTRSEQMSVRPSS
jgi:uncharacterized membrane protein HdeD (DUF308 family)